MAWVDRHRSYLSACKRIAGELRENPKASAFKRDEAYRAVVGNDCRKRNVAAAFLNRLKRRMPVDVIAKRVAANDRFGAPVLHAIDGHRWSAGSLRYLQVASGIGDASSVIEIGGGYGGQRLLCAGIQDYTIVDVPEALEVSRAYLDLHGLRTTFVEAGSPIDVKPGTFLLSDFALSELEPDLIAWYVREIVSKCEHGRITCSLSHRDAIVKLLAPVFRTLEFAPEKPRTSRHENVVITFQHAAKGLDAQVERWATTGLVADRLRSSEPWAFSRWGDGEWSAVLGLGHKNCDGQAYEPLREPLRKVLRDLPSYLLGMQPLAMERFGSRIRAWLNANAPDLPWVNADVFHDLSKQGSLLEFIAPLRDRSVMVVGPGYLRAVKSILPYRTFVEIPERDAYGAIDRIRLALASVEPGTVVALSAGMPANVLIHEFRGLPETTWIDFGSVWDPYVGKATRSYHGSVMEALAS